MSRPRKEIIDPKKRKQHEESLKRRRDKHAKAVSIEALKDGADSEEDFAALIEAEKLRVGKAELQQSKAAKHSPKTITAARENLTLAFDLMGGVPALVVWGRKNPTEFYRLWARLIPKESVELSAQIPLEALLAKLASREELSVGEAAFQIGSDILTEARHQIIDQDDGDAPGPDDYIN